MGIHRLAGVCLVGLVAIVGASCSSHSPASTPTTTGAPTSTSSTASVGDATSVGHQQSASGPSGQRISATATRPDHTGPELGGPPGSWVTGLVVENLGPASYQPSPLTEVTLVDASGKHYAPIKITPGATAIGSGQQERMLLYFVLTSGVQPTAVEFAPFGSSETTIRWNG
jgi:hypothetical protein